MFTVNARNLSFMISNAVSAIGLLVDKHNLIYDRQDGTLTTLGTHIHKNVIDKLSLLPCSLTSNGFTLSYEAFRMSEGDDASICKEESINAISLSAELRDHIQEIISWIPILLDKRIRVEVHKRPVTLTPEGHEALDLMESGMLDSDPISEPGGNIDWMFHNEDNEFPLLLDLEKKILYYYNLQYGDEYLTKDDGTWEPISRGMYNLYQLDEQISSHLAVTGIFPDTVDLGWEIVEAFRIINNSVVPKDDDKLKAHIRKERGKIEDLLPDQYTPKTLLNGGPRIQLGLNTDRDKDNRWIYKQTRTVLKEV